MANNYRPREDLRRRGSSYRDRERDPRDRDYRDHNRDRYNDNAHETFSPRRASDVRVDHGHSRDRDVNPSGSNRELVNANRSSADRSSSVMSPLTRKDSASDQASVASNVSKSNDARVSREYNIRRIADLLCKRQHYWMKGQEAETKYKGYQDDRKRNDSQFPEFASGEDTLDKHIEREANTRSKCTERINGLDQEIGPYLLSLLDKHLCSSPASTTLQPGAHQAQDVKIDGSASDQTVLALFRSEMQLEMKKFKEEMKSQHDSETRDLKNQHESEAQGFKKSLNEQIQRTQLLEEKLENLMKEVQSDCTHREKQIAAMEAKLIAASADLNNIRETRKTHMGQIEDISSGFEHLKQRTDELETKHKTSAANSLGAMNNVRNSMKEQADAGDKRLVAAEATLNKRITDLSTRIPQIPEQDIHSTHVKNTMEEQNAKISVALEDIRSLKDQFSQQRMASDNAQRKVQSIETSIESIKVNSDSMDNFIEETQKLKDQLARYDTAIKEGKEKQEKRDFLQDSHQRMISQLQSDYKKLIPDLKRMRHEGDTAGDDAVAKLEEFKSAVKASEPLMEEFKTANKDLRSLIEQSRIQEKHPIASQESPEIGTPHPGSATQTSGGGSYASTADLQAVAQQVEKFKGDTTTQVAKAIADTQLQLSKNGAVIGKFLDKEREARDATDVNVMDLGQKLGSVTKTVEVVKSSQIECATKLQDLMKRHASDVMLQRQELDTVRHQAYQAIGGVEGVQFQLSYLNNWRNNFSTKTLYKQIVDHIMATAPNGVSAQVVSMAERLNALEARQEEQATKKRKLYNGTAVAVNGNH